MTWFAKISSNEEVVSSVASNYVKCSQIHSLTSVSFSVLVNAENISFIYFYYNSFLKKYAFKRRLAKNDVGKAAIQKRLKYS